MPSSSCWKFWNSEDSTPLRHSTQAHTERSTGCEINSKMSMFHTHTHIHTKQGMCTVFAKSGRCNIFRVNERNPYKFSDIQLQALVTRIGACVKIQNSRNRKMVFLKLKRRNMYLDGLRTAAMFSHSYLPKHIPKRIFLAENIIFIFLVGRIVELWHISTFWTHVARYSMCVFAHFSITIWWLLRCCYSMSLQHSLTIQLRVGY